LGVPDHFMFNYSVNVLNNIKENFLAVYMTASNHGPYIIPPGINFTPKSKDIREQLVEYSDWSIGKFLNTASKQKWFSNTLFIFIADHGLNMGHTYDMPLSFHHSPFIIYSPYLIDSAAAYDCLGGQIDVAPTVLGLLNIKYVNNTLGIDLMHESRPYIFFSADEKIGCLDKTHFYIFRKNGIETLYEYKDLSVNNYLEELKPKADSMRNYAFSMMQSAEWVIENNKAGKINNQ
jgi:phosphoglycerol transferase MdoB-like AlkP superfamily enzyme